MRERRRSPRVQVDDEAVILAAGSAIVCRVVSRSRTGLSLDVDDIVGIPDRFSVEILRTGEVLRLAVRWRAEGRIGARLVPANAHMSAGRAEWRPMQ